MREGCLLARQEHFFNTDLLKALRDFVMRNVNCSEVDNLGLFSFFIYFLYLSSLKQTPNYASHRYKTNNIRVLEIKNSQPKLNHAVESRARKKSPNRSHLSPRPSPSPPPRPSPKKHTNTYTYYRTHKHSIEFYQQYKNMRNPQLVFR